MKIEAEDCDESIVTLDTYNSDLNLVLDASQYSAHPLTNEGFAFMWAGARATHGSSKGKFCFEVKLQDYIDVSHLPVDEPSPHVVRVGFSVETSTLQLGEDPLSYGYGGTAKISTNCQFKDFGEPFMSGDVILAVANMDSEQIQIGFAKNGRFVGWAYRMNRNELKGQGLFPHVLTKNVSFEVNFGQKEKPYFPLPDSVKDFIFVNSLPLDNKISGVRAPKRKQDCEIIMMCGLPGAGKSVWAAEHSKKNPNKKFNVLGTNNIIDKMKVMGLPRKRNYAGRWDVLIQMATKCLNKMFEIGSKMRRNYILDQTNVYPNAQRRKMRPFVSEGFNCKAVVVVPTDAEYKRRCDKRDREEGKEVPDHAILEMKANFKLPEVNDVFSAVIYTELPQQEAAKLVAIYNEEGRNAVGPPKKQFKSENFSNYGMSRSMDTGRGDMPSRNNLTGRDNYQNRERFDSSQRGFEGSRGRFEGSRRGFEGGRGGFEGGRGGFEGGQRGFDGSRGGFDGSRGGFEGSRGGFEGSRGGFGSNRGGFSGSRSGHDGGRGGFEGSARGGYGSTRRGYDSNQGTDIKEEFGEGYGENRGGFNRNRGGLISNRGCFDVSRGSFNRGRGSHDSGSRVGYNKGPVGNEYKSQFDRSDSVSHSGGYKDEGSQSLYGNNARGFGAQGVPRGRSDFNRGRSSGMSNSYGSHDFKYESDNAEQYGDISYSKESVRDDSSSRGQQSFQGAPSTFRISESQGRHAVPQTYNRQGNAVNRQGNVIDRRIDKVEYKIESSSNRQSSGFSNYRDAYPEKAAGSYRGTSEFNKAQTSPYGPIKTEPGLNTRSFESGDKTVARSSRPGGRATRWSAEIPQSTDWSTEGTQSFPDRNESSSRTMDSYSTFGVQVKREPIEIDESAEYKNYNAASSPYSSYTAGQTNQGYQGTQSLGYQASTSPSAVSQSWAGSQTNTGNALMAAPGSQNQQQWSQFNPQQSQQPPGQYYNPYYGQQGAGGAPAYGSAYGSN